MGCNSKNKNLWQKQLIVEVDQTFLKMPVENLVKVTRIGKVMGRKQPPTLRELSFEFRH